MAAIKTEYDAALHGALKASAENMSMRTQLADAEERKVIQWQETQGGGMRKDMRRNLEKLKQRQRESCCVSWRGGWITRAGPRGVLVQSMIR